MFIIKSISTISNSQNLSLLKKIFSSITGYWIYKQNHLPIGADLKIDINKKLDFYPKVIFDIGANIGQTSKYFNQVFKSHIYSFEPVNETYEILVSNVKNIHSIYTHNIGFGSESGTFKIPKAEHCEWNSMVNGLNSSEEYYSLKIETLDEFIKNSNVKSIDLLKTDTEGFDLEVLKGASLALQKGLVKIILTEVGFYPHDIRHTNFEQVRDYLSGYDYQLYGFYDIRKGVYANALFTHSSLFST